MAKSKTNIKVVIESIILFLWASTLIYLLWTGKFKTYVQAGLWFLPAFAMLVLIIMYLVRVAALDGNHSAKNLTYKSWAKYIIILVPVIYIFAAPASGLNSYALSKHKLNSVSKQQMVIAEMFSALAVEFPGFGIKPPHTINDSELPLSQIFLDGDKLCGSETATTGRVNLRPDLPNGYLEIYRYSIICCAAHAIPFSVIVSCPKEIPLKQDEWVKVNGVISTLQINGGKYIGIDADDISKITPPANPYLPLSF
ncbi:MAG: TIGR03943 family protein [candidate division Zixibacteria bacterium]|nr:TIGR03943 family protein [candidate division Zixibacteria bacterium]